jgi:acyl-coenzyme A thioesterase PaaI-like protein
MDVTTVPFNRFLGLEKAPPESGFLMTLPPGPHYANHLGTIHASALLALAEVSSAEYLLRHYGDPAGLLPVVRRVEAKFRQPARGRVSARAVSTGNEMAELRKTLAARGRALVQVAIEVVDEGEVVVMSALVEWFVTRTDRPG